MKKNLLFVCYGLGIGGIEKCLVNLINAIPEDQYDIDILLMNPEYELKNQIHRKVNYLDIFQYVMNTTDTMPEIKNRGGILKNIGWTFRYYAFRVANKMGKNAWKFFKSLSMEYDFAIAYSHHDYSKYYVIDKVKAKKKYLFYHNGAYEFSNKQYELDQKYFPKFDSIFTVSKDAKNVLIDKFPNLKDKIKLIHNIIDKNIIKQQSKEPCDIDENIFSIVTVARMTEEKGIHSAVEIANRLKNEHVIFKWYWIGDGNQHSIVRQEIHDNQLDNYFILKGNQLNPYKYISHSNLYVQPSRYEAYCTTTNEARILKKVVVTTNVGGMSEQVTNDVTGYICDSLDELHNRIYYLINHNNKLKELGNNIPEYDFSDYINEYEQIFK